MSSLQWDHTVHYVNDLEPVVRTFTDNGLAAFPGGSHKLWGTHNALSYFGLNYVEFLAVENRELAESADPANLVVKDAMKLLPEHEGFSRVAIRTDDIEETATLLHQQGLKLSPIMDGRRLNKQGQWIEWRMLTIGGHFQGLVYPFVIQWKGTDGQRQQELKTAGIIRPHPAGTVEVRAAIFSVSDPVATAAHWSRILGLSVPNAGSWDGNSVFLTIGDKAFVFRQGTGEQMQELLLATDAPGLVGRTIRFGQADYVFTAL